MTATDAAALDAAVVNARQRFRRVLAAWAVDVLALTRDGASRVRWIEPPADSER